MPFEQHRDITPQKRPERPGNVTMERVRSYLFFDLLKEALGGFEEAEQKGPEKVESPVRSLEFFFKKAWDRFTEPLSEYEDLRQNLETKTWESHGAEKRARNELAERRRKSILGVREILPDFEMMPKDKQRQSLARIYEGYASYLSEKGEAIQKMVRGLPYGYEDDLKTLLHLWGRSRPDNS